MIWNPKSILYADFNEQTIGILIILFLSKNNKQVALLPTLMLQLCNLTRMRIYFSLSVSFTDSLYQDGKQLELSSTLTMSSKQLRSTQAGMTIAMYFFFHQKLPLMVHHVVTIVHPSQIMTTLCPKNPRKNKYTNHAGECTCACVFGNNNPQFALIVHLLLQHLKVSYLHMLV